MKTKLFALAVAFAFGAAAQAADKDIVDTASGDPHFSTLVKAVKEAGLAEMLKEKGPFTVFAPTDEAFAKLGEEKLKAAMADKALLKKILQAHVVEGKWMAEDVTKLDGKDVKTAGGQKVHISVKDGHVMVGHAKVTKTDVKASNGVIHVIDTVLMPEEK